MSANVVPDGNLIRELDNFRLTGTYTDANGNTVKVDNLSKFSYKSPQTLAGWNKRQDPLTFYFGSEVNDETYKAISEITGRYARGTVYNANPDTSWVSNIETNPTEQMVTNLASELRNYSEALSDRMLSEFQSQREQLSSGQYEAYKNILEYFKEAARQA